MKNQFYICTVVGISSKTTTNKMKNLYSIISLMVAFAFTANVSAQQLAPHDLTNIKVSSSIEDKEAATPKVLVVANFSEKISEKAVQINWSAGKLSTDGYYEVEQSTDGVHFVTAGMVLDGFEDEAGVTHFVFKISKASVAPKKAVYFRVKQSSADSVLMSQVFTVKIGA